MTAVGANLVGTGLALAGFFLITLLIFGGIIASTTPTAQPVRSGSVLVLNLPGPIPEVVSGDPFAQAFGQEPAFGLFDLTQAIERAAEDSRIEALWIQTGASAVPWASLQSIRRALKTFKQSGKPVVASSPSFTLNEGGYFLSSLADSVFADPHAMIEFNGMALSVSFYADLLDRLDVNVEAVRVGTFKSAVEPYFRTDMSDASREQMQRIADGVAGVFVDAVADDRGLTNTRVNEIMATQALMTAPDALDAGLLDGLRYDDQIRRGFLRVTGQEPGETLRTTSIKSYVREARSNSRNGRDGDVAVVYVVGAMVPGRTSDVPNPLLGGTTIGSESFVRTLRKARNSDRTKAIVVRINSPGGVVPAADAMLAEIRAAAKDVPVIVSMGGVAASGGYWIAAGAQSIVAESLTITGSIGVFALLIDTSEFLKNKIGITHDGVKSHPYADMLSGVKRVSDGERAMLQRSTNHVYDSFLQLVADGRNLTVEEVDAVAQGRVWTGKDALEHGLIDEFGGLERAIAIAAESAGLPEGEFRTRIYSTSRGFLARLTEPAIRAAAGVMLSVGGYGSYQSLAEGLSGLSEVIQYNGTMMARMPYDIEMN